MVAPAAAGQRQSSVTTFFSWAWKILLGVLAIAGGIGTAASKDFRHAIRDGAEWLYPFWLVILLAAISVGLAIALLLALRSSGRHRAAAAQAEGARRDAEERLAEHEQRTSSERVAHDTNILRTIRETLPRADIDFWRDTDLGGVWYGGKTYHLMEMLNDHNAVEDRFLDPELERLREQLMSAVNKLMGKCAQYGIPHRTLDNAYHLGDSDWVRDNPPEGERYERYEARRDELNQAADELVRAYDGLMTGGRARLPGAFGRSA
ncbi:MAG: hypothetical protein ACRDLS_04480 [Solirubrobacteraceae bacterium]